MVLPALKKRLGADATVVAGTLGTAAVLATFALVDNQALAVCASALAGISWIAVLSSLHVSAQTALPDWVRARGLSFFLTVFFGAMSAGSLIWGQVAELLGIGSSLLIAASGAVLMIPLVWRARLNLGEALDLAPSMHWPAPVLDNADQEIDGPVMIQVEYHVPTDNRPVFLELLRKLRSARRRNGAFRWTLMRDANDEQRFVETWFEASWTDHLRHHDRVSEEDKMLQSRIADLQAVGHVPIVRHLVSP